MQTLKVIFVVACLAGVTSAASWHRTSGLCEKCKADMDKYKADPNLEEEWIADCKKLDDKEDQDECIEEAERYIHKLKTETSEQICQEFDPPLCPRNTSCPGLTRQAINYFPGNIQVKVPQRPTCEECKAAMAAFKQMLPRYEAQMIDNCKKMPTKEQQEECIAAVKKQVERLSKETPKQICQEMDPPECPRKIGSN